MSSNPVQFPRRSLRISLSVWDMIKNSSEWKTVCVCVLKQAEAKISPSCFLTVWFLFLKSLWVTTQTHKQSVSSLSNCIHLLPLWRTKCCWCVQLCRTLLLLLLLMESQMSWHPTSCKLDCRADVCVCVWIYYYISVCLSKQCQSSSIQTAYSISLGRQRWTQRGCLLLLFYHQAENFD